MNTTLGATNETMDDLVGAGAWMGWHALTGMGEISPLTMDPSWDPNKRLIFTIAICVIDLMFNGLYMAAFFVAETLNQTGNTFLCCLGLMDMIMGGVVPMVSVVVQLSKEGDNADTCRAVQMLVTFCNYSYMLLYLFCAAENYYNIAWASKGYLFFNKKQVAIIVSNILALSAALAAVGTYGELDYDFCSRQHIGNMVFRYTTLIFLYAIPLLFTCFYLGYGIIRLRTRSREPNYKRSQHYKDEMSQIITNFFVYVVHICFWAPFMTAIYHYADTITNQKLFLFAWIGLARSVCVPIFYGFCKSTFRTAYIQSFCYCCCKGSFPARGQFNNRHRRATEYKSPSGDVRVHLLQHKQHPGSPQRATLSSREGQEL